MFSPQAPLKVIALLAREWGTMLNAGLPLTKSLDLLAKKVTHPRTRAALRSTLDELREGQDISSSLASHGELFPKLFIDMITVGEETGALPEVLLHLADHYENNQRLRSETIRSLAWPAIQLVIGIFVIALLIFVLGMLASSGAGADMSFLTFGLKGPVGAVIWLTVSFGSFGGLALGWTFLRRAMNAKQIVDPILMQIPIVGPCLRAFAIARFSWAYFLTQQSGMPVTRSLQLSIKATDNGRFLNALGDLCHDVQSGETITEAFAKTGLFPEDYIAMVAVAEESGTVPEALHRLSPQFEEQARRSLKLMTSAITVAVWLFLAGFVIYFVFSFVLWYVGMLKDAAQGKF